MAQQGLSHGTVVWGEWMRRFVGCLLFWGCSSSSNDTGGDTDEQGESTPPPIREHEFGEWTDWARPIDDVLEIGQAEFGDDFSHGIHDLKAHQDRLWMGYGDANVNLGGVVPISFRAFTDANEPTIEIGMSSGEEQIDRFRLLDGVLWVPGVDSLGTDEEVHFPLIGGNVYTLDDQVWNKHATVHGGEHVHDVASWDGAAWAVGSGADNRDEFESGQIHRYLWRSQDDGVSWMTMTREPFPDPGSGDTRWVHLLPQEDDLYLFGYEYNWIEGVVSVSNARFDGWDLHSLSNSETLEDIYAFGTLDLGTDLGLVWGVDVDEFSLQNEAWWVEDGERHLLESLSGRSLVDVTLREDTGELLFLSYEGDVYGAAQDEWSLALHVAAVDSPDDMEELRTWSDLALPRSIEFYEGALFLGTEDGAVRRSQGTVH